MRNAAAVEDASGTARLTRRTVLAAMGAAALIPVAALHLGAPTSGRPSAPAYVFFDAAEARFVEAACERLIPADTAGPGALSADVPRYLDRQLAGAWGAGIIPYRGGSWQAGTPSVVRWARFAPALLFRTALSAMRGTPFHRWPAGAQDAYLRQLAAGGATLAGVPSQVFFQMLLALTVEGFFSHPVHGGTRDRVAWSMVGFPGAHAAELKSAATGYHRGESIAGDGP
jgi:gluconate 2-dehydrogenase gamma chain